MDVRLDVRPVFVVPWSCRGDDVFRGVWERRERFVGLAFGVVADGAVVVVGGSGGGGGDSAGGGRGGALGWNRCAPKSGMVADRTVDATVVSIMHRSSGIMESWRERWGAASGGLGFDVGVGKVEVLSRW